MQRSRPPTPLPCACGGDDRLPDQEAFDIAYPSVVAYAAIVVFTLLAVAGGVLIGSGLRHLNRDAPRVRGLHGADAGHVADERRERVLRGRPGDVCLALGGWH